MFMALTPPQYKLQANTEFFNKYFQKFRYPSFGYTYLGYNLLDPKVLGQKGQAGYNTWDQQKGYYRRCPARLRDSLYRPLPS